MKLVKAREDYYYFTGKASEVTRQLGLAGIAVVWIFKLEKSGALSLPSQLLPPLIAFVGALALDLLQYVTSALIWGAFTRYNEKMGVKDGGDVYAPAWFNYPSLLFFWAKVSTAVFGYVLLLLYLSERIGAA